MRGSGYRRLLWTQDRPLVRYNGPDAQNLRPLYPPGDPPAVRPGPARLQLRPPDEPDPPVPGAFHRPGRVLRRYAQSSLLYLIPAILAFTVPMAVIMGILAGLSRLSSDSEIVAFKTSRRSARPDAPAAVHLRLRRLAGDLGPDHGPDAPFQLQVDRRPSPRPSWTRPELQFNPREFNESIHRYGALYRRHRQDRIGRTSSSPSPPVREAARPAGRRGPAACLSRSRRGPSSSSSTPSSTPSPSPNRTLRTRCSRAPTSNRRSMSRACSSFTAEKRVREQNIDELPGAGRGPDPESGACRPKRPPSTAANVRPRQSGPGQERLWPAQKAEHDRRSYGVEIHKRFALPFVCWIFVFSACRSALDPKRRPDERLHPQPHHHPGLLCRSSRSGNSWPWTAGSPPFLGIGGGKSFSARSACRVRSSLGGSCPLRLVPPPADPPAAERRTRVRPRAGSCGRRFARFGFPNILDRYFIRKYLFIAVLVISARRHLGRRHLLRSDRKHLTP